MKRYFEPNDESCIPYGRDRSFSCNGTFTIEVPAGQVIVHVERGKEYLPVDRLMSVSGDSIAIFFGFTSDTVAFSMPAFFPLERPVSMFPPEVLLFSAHDPAAV